MDLCIEIRVRDRLDLCVIVLLKRKLTHSRRINSTLIVCELAPEIGDNIEVLLPPPPPRCRVAHTILNGIGFASCP